MTVALSAVAITLTVLGHPVFSQTPAEPRYPPPGKLVDVGGYRVHLNCTGHGPTTVMIVGAGYSFDWSLVQSETAKFTRVCTYDPSGSVWSDPNPSPTCDGRVEEIHTMLRNAGITGPLVLVGHSIAAVWARLYAARYPDDVQGMVLGDHAGRYRFAHAEGMLRSEEQTLQKLSPSARAMHRWAESQPGASDSFKTRQFFATCIAEVGTTTKTRPDPLGNKPLIVIANGYLAGSEDYQQVQAGLLALSHNSKAMVSPNSSHGIPTEDPDIFIRANQEVVSAVATR
jgi:pimeloyl-ACP methyl ester carboxylesterase